MPLFRNAGVRVAQNPVNTGLNEQYFLHGNVETRVHRGSLF